jgi:hypothetical protein
MAKVSAYYDSLLGEIQNSDKADAFLKYYKRTTACIVKPYSKPKEVTEFPTSAQAILDIRSTRQIDTRKQFWRLFRHKFGIRYYDFLTNTEARKMVMSLSPEPLGPNCFDPLTPKEGKNFIEAWKKEVDEENSRSFADFFAQYKFPSVVEEQDNINGTKDTGFPGHAGEFRDEDDEDGTELQQWYWEQASVPPYSTT